MSTVGHGHFCPTDLIRKTKKAPHPWLDRCANSHKLAHVEHHIHLWQPHSVVCGKQNEFILWWANFPELSKTRDIWLSATVGQRAGVAWPAPPDEGQIWGTDERIFVGTSTRCCYLSYIYSCYLCSTSPATNKKVRFHAIVSSLECPRWQHNVHGLNVLVFQCTNVLLFVARITSLRNILITSVAMRHNNVRAAKMFSCWFQE